MSRLVFVTTELQPETPGGAGVAVEALSRGLSGRYEIVILLLVSDPVEIQSRDGVSVIQASIPETGFVERSQAAAEAIASVVQPDDRVEFQDFEGIAFHALASRARYGLDRVLATVRFHGTYDLIIEAAETRPLGMDLPAVMEREVLQMADQVLVASPGQRQTVIDRYQLETDRVVVSPLPVPPITPGGRQPAHPPVFAVIGRLDERKGPQDVVRAAIRLLERGLDFKVRFVGLDGWSPTNYSPMTEWLETLIGPHVDHFEFTGAVPRDQLGETLGDVTAVIVPSRFETFCYVAYEARLLGHPLIVADLDVFDGLFSVETGTLVYDRSTPGLAQAMRRLITDPDLAGDLARRPVPEPGEPWPAYEVNPEPRHVRSQAGMGTAAVQRFEAAASAGPVRPERGFIQRLYRLVPAPLVAFAYKVIPRPLQRRLAKRLSWSEESKRRRYEDLLESQPEPEPPPLRGDHEERLAEFESRHATVQARIAGGEFPALDNPDVTVVVPVYNEASYLEETLLSVFEQTHLSWEIVVVDDGSTTPEAKEIIAGLDYPRVRIIRQKNKGLPGARNTGVGKARGRFIVPLDADDQLLPTFMETMIAALEASPGAAYAHCYALLHHDIDAFWVTRPFNPYWQLLGNGVFGCVLIRKDVLDQVGGYDTTMKSGNEDWELWLRLMAAGWDQVQVGEVLVKYRKHGVSMSVLTEARFEEGRRAVRDRHHALYADLPSLKRRWYPLVTVIGDNLSSGNVELETVATVGELDETWGKYVVDLRGAGTIPEETLLTMANTLEAQPDLARVVTTGSPPLVMVRRWNLHDPDAGPQGEVVLDLVDSGSPMDLPPMVPREGWTVPATDPDEWRPVQRQPPEEEGHLPDVSAW